MYREGRWDVMLQATPPPLGPLFALHNPSLPTPFLHALNAATSLYSTLDNLHGIPDTL